MPHVGTNSSARAGLSPGPLGAGSASGRVCDGDVLLSALPAPFGYSKVPSVKGLTINRIRMPSPSRALVGIIPTGSAASGMLAKNPSNSSIWQESLQFYMGAKRCNFVSFCRSKAISTTHLRLIVCDHQRSFNLSYSMRRWDFNRPRTSVDRIRAAALESRTFGRAIHRRRRMMLPEHTSSG